VNEDAADHIFRVTLRGRFLDLSDEARRYLEGVKDEHDIFRSEYSKEGTLTYDSRIDFFNLRYEIRAGGDRPSEAAAEQGLKEADAFLRTMRFGYRDLKVNVVDMSAIWVASDRRRRR
jgi:hypothetical protein